MLDCNGKEIELGVRVRVIAEATNKTGSPTSIDTVRNAKARLKKKGFIDFTNTGKTTEYRLVKLYDDTDPSAAGLVCYTAHAEDVKTIEEKDNYQSAGANINEVDKLIELWEAAGGSKLNQLLLSKLASLLDAYAYETIKVAINKASESNNSNYGFSFKFLTSILEKEEKPVKGSERNGKQYEYEVPEYGDNEPWDNY